MVMCLSRSGSSVPRRVKGYCHRRSRLLRCIPSTVQRGTHDYAACQLIYSIANGMSLSVLAVVVEDQNLWIRDVSKDVAVVQNQQCFPALGLNDQPGVSRIEHEPADQILRIRDGVREQAHVDTGLGLAGKGGGADPDDAPDCRLDLGNALRFRGNDDAASRCFLRLQGLNDDVPVERPDREPAVVDRLNGVFAFFGRSRC